MSKSTVRITGWGLPGYTNRNPHGVTQKKEQVWRKTKFGWQKAGIYDKDTGLFKSVGNLIEKIKK